MLLCFAGMCILSQNQINKQWLKKLQQERPDVSTNELVMGAAVLRNLEVGISWPPGSLYTK